MKPTGLKLKTLAASLLLLVLAAIPVSAHHAFAAEFDSKKPIKLRGTVTKMEWINPHAWIHVDVKNADNVVEEWMVEAGSPNTLLRRGLTKDSLKIGRDVTLPNGQTLFIGSNNPDAPNQDRPK
jgi:hypothetical protein